MTAAPTTATTTHKAPKAYIYSRISSKGQEQGAGLNRQRDVADEYCQRHGLTPHERHQDIGSGYHGKQMEGALGAFLYEIEQGNVEKGSALVVESLDRLGRENTIDALQRLITIIRAGISVHEISTGTVYSSDNHMTIHVALAVMERAHNESLMKSRRSKDNIQRKYNNYKRGDVVRGTTPLWIDVTPSGLVLNHHAKAVKRIFDLYLAGNGANSIAQTLKLERVPYMGVADGWNSNKVLSVLKSKSTCGYFESSSGVVIDDYYPACVSVSDFENATRLRSARGKGKAKTRKIATVLSGCVRCSCCGGSYTYVANSWVNKAGERTKLGYLRCQNKAIGLRCQSKSIQLNTIERAVLELLPGIDVNSVNRSVGSTLKNMRAQLTLKREQGEKLIDLVLGGSDIAKQRLKNLESEIHELESHVRALEARVIPSVPKTDVEAVISGDNEYRKKIHAALSLMGLCVETDGRVLKINLNNNEVHTGLIRGDKK